MQALWDYAEKNGIKIEGLENQRQIFMRTRKKRNTRGSEKSW